MIRTYLTKNPVTLVISITLLGCGVGPITSTTRPDKDTLLLYHFTYILIVLH